MSKIELDSKALFLAAEHSEDKGEFSQAFRYLRDAARQGHASSQLNLGNYYSSGLGVKKSLQDAAYWYRKAYKNGNATGAFNLGIDQIRAGEERSALIWFRKALDMREGEAAVELAKIYLNKPRRRKEAYSLLRAAVEMTSSEINDSAKQSAIALLSSLDHVPRSPAL